MKSFNILVIFEIDKTQVISKEILSTGDSGHGALATLLADKQIELLICGNIGPGAINAIKNAKPERKIADINPFLYVFFTFLILIKSITPPYSNPAD